LSQAVTELVIEADTSGADAYSRAMDGAADAAARGTSAASGFNVGLAVLGTRIAAAALSIKQGLDYVVEFNKSLADMGQIATRVGLSLKDLQGVQFGGQVAGLSESQVNTGLEKSAQLLNDAQRNANSLSKEFEANGLSIRNANGQLISQNQLLQVAADLVRRAASPQDAIAIAQMLGFTKEWVPLLEQGAAHIRNLGDEAQKAGGIIDDETIKRAADFDEKWRKSSVEWSTYMKAAIADMLPAVDDLIDRAVKLIQDVKQRARVSGDVPRAVAETAADGILNSTGIGDRGIAIDTTGLERSINEWNQSPVFSTETWGNLGHALWNGFKIGATPQEAESFVPGLASKRIVEPSYPTAAQMDAAFDKANPPDPGSRAHPLAGLTADDYEASNPSKVASRDTGGVDAVDRAINTLRRHTEQQEADAKAVSLGAGALAGFRAEAAESSAVQANNGKETEAQKKAFSDLRDQAIAAADALAKAKVASQIDFGRKTALLSQDDVAIATQLKNIYGNDVVAALNSTEAAQLRLNKTLREGADAFQNAAAPALLDFETGAKKGSDAIKAFEQQFIKSLLSMANQALIFGPISKALQGVVSGGFSLSGLVASAQGNVFAGGNVVPFAQGGVVDSPTIAPMALFGERGPEAIMPLRRGPDGNLGVASHDGGGSTNITYQIDASGADSGTVEAIKKVLADHARTLQAHAKTMTSAQRFQSTGVG
jgi:hypothetical protein